MKQNHRPQSRTTIVSVSGAGPAFLRGTPLSGRPSHCQTSAKILAHVRILDSSLAVKTFLPLDSGMGPCCGAVSGVLPGRANAHTRARACGPCDNFGGFLESVPISHCLWSAHGTREPHSHKVQSAATKGSLDWALHLLN